MINEDIYKSIEQQDGLRKSSYIGIIPRNIDEEWNLNSFENLLKRNREFKVSLIKDITKEINDDLDMGEAILALGVVFEYNNVEYSSKIGVYSTEYLDLQSYGFVNTVDQESCNIALNAPYYLETELIYGEEPTMDYLIQLKLLHTLVPVAAIGIDFSSLRVFSPYWLEMTAASAIPPAPTYLYSVHSVYNDREDGKRDYWLHTHGLHRCGTVDLEMLITDYPQEMFDMLKSVVHLTLDKSIKENESIQVGYDGMELNVCWIRWEEALQRFKPDVLGGIGDRIDDEGNINVHGEPSGILFAVEDNNLASPEIYGPTLKGNPIFFISKSETDRMSALAKERFSLFKEIFEKYGKVAKKGLLNKLFKRENKEEWKFLVKLGLTTDGSDIDGEDKEHLWFEVKDIDRENRVLAKLINSPYWISALKEGDEKEFPVFDLLTDWCIYAPEMYYSPDNIYAYYHQ